MRADQQGRHADPASLGRKGQPTHRPEATLGSSQSNAPSLYPPKDSVLASGQAWEEHITDPLPHIHTCKKLEWSKRQHRKSQKDLNPNPVLPWVLVCSSTYNKNKLHTLISHSSRAWEVQDQDVGRCSMWRKTASWFIDSHRFCVLIWWKG